MFPQKVERSMRKKYLWSGITRHPGFSKLNPNLLKTEVSIGECMDTSPSLQTKTRSVKAETSENCHRVFDRNFAWSILLPLI